MRANQIIAILTAVLVFFVAIGSFALSYNALQDMAIQNGITGNLSYVWPLLIDASLIVFSLAVVNAQLHAESTWKQWALVGLYTVATISFNVLHAPPNVQARIVAAIAPLSLFFSFELLMAQLRSSVARSTAAHTLRELHKKTAIAQNDLLKIRETVVQFDAQQNEQKAALLAEIEDLNSQIVQLTEQRNTAKMNIANVNSVPDEIKQAIQVDALLAAGLSKTATAEMCNISRNTVNHRLGLCNGSGLRSKAK